MPLKGYGLLIMSIENRLWILMGKRLSGSISEPESLELDALFQIYPDVWYTYEILIGLEEKEVVPDTFIKEIKTLLAYEEVNSANEPAAERSLKKSAVPMWIRAAVAAVILVGFSLGLIGVYGYFHTTSVIPNKNNEIIVLNGTKTDVDLPDGSKVILNAGSKLTYPKNYANAVSREVFLSGEAYFKVQHDKQHPFIIHTAHFDIRDIGTTFNVKAYPGEKTAEASLIDGSIEISFKNNGSKKILLRPRQKVVLINNDADKETVTAAAADKQRISYKVVGLNINTDVKSEFAETAWVNNELVFRNETFESLAKRMERKYNVEISFGDDKIKSSNVTGIFKNETIDQALKTLQLITPFKYEINHNKIVIQSSDANG